MPIHNTRLEKQVRVLPEHMLGKAVSPPSLVKSPRPHQDTVKRAKKREKQTESGLTSCLTASSSNKRIGGGANDPAPRNAGKLPRTDSECQFKAPGFHFLTERDTTLSTHEVKMSPRVVMKKELKHKCDFFSKIEDSRPFKNKTTQTLYRESSAQTLAYLPEILETKNFNKLELFSLPSVLPGANRPGLHEVEVLERARKRWAFSDALKIHFKRLLKEAREVAIKTEFNEILEAFEWEQWVQREEDIQECQMMRLQIVIKMFDKREKEMHAASKSRIEKACERIEERRLAGLRKNEIEFQRGMRRLEIQLSRTPRRWKKQMPMHSLGSPCSEFYAPLLRYGVDPAHRNYVSKTERNAFDMRIDELEKKVNMKHLKCPFRKLKDWSKPKTYDQEYERNFCKEDNLQKLFESLKSLRTQAAREKEDPKCLKKRRRRELGRVASQMALTYLTDLYDVKSESSSESYEKGVSISKYAGFLEAEANQNSEIVMTSLKNERKREGMENLLNIYEGTYIGWVMQFLSDEMTRLSELRRLHFFAIMAQKERWRREAAEAGLRQKENDMRLMYEELFQNCNVVNNEISNKYFAQILSSDMYNVADYSAGETVSEMAKQIDTDIERWLESFKLIQNPLTYVPLRLMLKDMVSPDMDKVLQRYENSLIVQYVVEDVIFQKVWTELDPFDIGSTLTSDLIDRLIDNDLYLMSTDSESEIPQKASWREANAIIRKLIRRAVPGRRWLEENERIVAENYNDLFDDLFVQILQKMENPPPVKSADLIDLRMTPSQGDIHSTDNIREKENINAANISLKGSDFMGRQTLTLIKKLKDDHITGALVNVDKPLGDDPPSGSDQFIKSEMITPISNLTVKPSDVFSLRSTLDLSQASNLASLIGRGYRVMLPSEVERNASTEIVKLLVKESDEEQIFETEGDIVEHEGLKDMKMKAKEEDRGINSPKVSFHEIHVPVIPAKEMSSEVYHTPKFLDNREDIKEDAKGKPKPLEITSLELDLETHSSHDNLVPIGSTPKEIMPVPHPIPRELTPTSSGSNDIKPTPRELVTPTEADPEPESKPEAEPKLRTQSEPKEEPQTKAKEEPKTEPEFKSEPTDSAMVEESDSFIPPVRSSGVKNLNPTAALLKSDSTKIKGKAVPIKKDKSKAQVQESEVIEDNEERRHRGSLGSHFNPIDAVIPIETSDDHLPVTAELSRSFLDPENLN
ncbi:uncharacterized protein LOC108033829 [Drosophila biarmipes]|uniref:uncharacterized protein LOC108033829 n=1 Tax=Drosophila biarmipes TaxID=125945 RepID=UPI0007E5CBE2|nr:uncharacterized protein LOC108033829 [Drosophila biarmipes]